MKNTVYFIALFVFISIQALSQKINPTTEAEYLYGSVGYKIQLNNKLPTKEGYTLRDFKPVVEEYARLNLKVFIVKVKTNHAA
ncbi:MAG: hypothetical protein IPJ93_06360 [Bacteroidota bacterium]|nr:MAG: hypothetical protein IPJ93_06360 [Bacteroidota bacterium]